jgi:hypothetical protein
MCVWRGGRARGNTSHALTCHLPLRSPPHSVLGGGNHLPFLNQEVDGTS